MSIFAADDELRACVRRGGLFCSAGHVLGMYGYWLCWKLELGAIAGVKRSFKGRLDGTWMLVVRPFAIDLLSGRKTNQFWITTTIRHVCIRPTLSNKVIGTCPYLLCKSTGLPKVKGRRARMDGY